jgi:hypothetical protein
LFHRVDLFALGLVFSIFDFVFLQRLLSWLFNIDIVNRKWIGEIVLNDLYQIVRQITGILQSCIECTSNLSSAEVAAAAAIVICVLFRLRANIKKLKLHFSIIFCAE